MQSLDNDSRSGPDLPWWTSGLSECAFLTAVSNSACISISFVLFDVHFNLVAVSLGVSSCVTNCLKRPASENDSFYVECGVKLCQSLTCFMSSVMLISVSLSLVLCRV